ncbi:hypothetical protein RFI_00161 [Reticulomyxa filosa]|uniref:Uncharacterized protein n=1 Tax=Reticulomyxa filosa TaxID=46433 RepID=X6PGV6_RETFI|nr:hypothetical protein RFI_00161 [Reticulomyxa filosa]|eukprot:ETO36902.1 hypothetical protein RFI_00161 [Reticulomyxa filosa]
MDIADMKAEGITNMEPASPFQTLASLSVLFSFVQCIAYKNEIIIYGGNIGKCFSYYMVKNQYKFYVDNSNDKNELTLLCFSEENELRTKHTLAMSYKSVWEDNETNEKGSYNKWIPFKKNNKKISINRSDANYVGARSVISGSADYLLFITYYPNDISVFNLKTFQYIKDDILPVGCQIEINKQNEMMLFYNNIGLLIKYDENKNIFEYHKVRVCATIKISISCVYVCVNDAILFFGDSKHVHKYLMTENKWMRYESNTYVHIFGRTRKDPNSLVHIKTTANEWMKEDQRWIVEDKETIESEEICIELEEMDDEININQLKKTKKVETIIQYWFRSLLIDKTGWINEFDVIILRYILVSFFFFFDFTCFICNT